MYIYIYIYSHAMTWRYVDAVSAHFADILRGDMSPLTPLQIVFCEGHFLENRTPTDMLFMSHEYIRLFATNTTSYKRFNEHITIWTSDHTSNPIPIWMSVKNRIENAMCVFQLVSSSYHTVFDMDTDRMNTFMHVCRCSCPISLSIFMNDGLRS